jgi:hypothetical protein
MTTRAGERPKTVSGHRPVPERKPELGHLTLDGLRQLRRSLTDEENRVSYWRRLIQARLDLLRELQLNEVSKDGRAAALRTALHEVRPTRARSAFLPLLPADDHPPLPDLAALWAREVSPGDAAALTDLTRQLAFAELQLSAYRGALHRRLANATEELIARYHEDPSACLSVLPNSRSRAAGG